MRTVLNRPYAGAGGGVETVLGRFNGGNSKLAASNLEVQFVLEVLNKQSVVKQNNHIIHHLTDRGELVLPVYGQSG